MIIKKHLYYLLLGSLCAVFAACGGSSSIPMAEVGSSAKSIDTTNYPPPRQMGPSAIRATLSENFNVEAWAIQNGAPGRATGATGIGVDDKGNSYVAGVTFENIPGQEPGRNSNYFIAKHASNGTPQWIRQVGIAGGSTEAAGISVDSNGNSYVTGSTTVGLSGQIQDGIKDYFIAKYDLDGNLQWARQVGALGGRTEGKGISVDSSGNSYVTGYTTAGISGQTQKNSYSDYFIAKYGPDGQMQWTRQVGASSVKGGSTEGRGISVDSKGNSYVTGSTSTGISGQKRIGCEDYFIAKYDSDGNLQWTRQVGGPAALPESLCGFTSGEGISVDSSGNSYLTGFTFAGLLGQKQNGRSDYFIAKYDSDGNLQWARQVGGFDGHTEGKGVSVDSMGNSYVTGKTTTGLSGQTQKGDRDYFIAKYNTNGILLEASQEGTLGGITGAYGISLDGAGNRYVTGATTIGIFGQTQKDDLDYFIVKNR